MPENSRGSRGLGRSARCKQNSNGNMASVWRLVLLILRILQFRALWYVFRLHSDQKQLNALLYPALCRALPLNPPIQILE
jgi:hypothetical protein